MGLLAALLLCAAEPGVGEAPPPAAEPPRWGVTLGLGLDALTFSFFRVEALSFWGELDFTCRVVRWLRLGVLLGGAYAPQNRPSFPGEHGVFRALAGADLVLPLRFGELFAGVAAGLQHTNLLGDEDFPAHPGYSSAWGTGLGLLVRVGGDFHVSERVSIGGVVAYELFAWIFDRYHSVELRWRLTFAF